MAGSIAILGAGESGVGSAILAQKKGFDVLVSDKGTIAEKYKNVLLEYEIRFEEGKHSEALILEAEEVIKSPGIPDEVPLIKQLHAQGTPVISEIEFAGRYTEAHITGITGSNGKTTTTLLTHHILSKAGLNVGVAGNVGQSFAWQVAETERDYYVLELSSFQLDGMYDFRCNTAVLLNITPDHLDRYGNDFSRYAAAKFRILQNQRPEDAFVYCLDDKVIEQGMKQRKVVARHFPFSLDHEVETGAYVAHDQLNISTNNQTFTMSIRDLALQGKHNLHDTMAAGISGRILELRKDVIRDSLSDFQNVEHRLEFVTKVHGISFVNDSKATNVNSTWYALESVNNPVIWIVGGVDKGNDYGQLMELVKENVKAIICLGRDNSKLHAVFGEVKELVFDAGSMYEAVGIAYQIGERGDTVLLSPACASFDLFENFEDRGRQFKEVVRSL